MPDLSKYSNHERGESVRELLNLGLVAHMESVTPPSLQHSPEAVKKFQKENLPATVCKYVSKYIDNSNSTTMITCMF